MTREIETCAGVDNCYGKLFKVMPIVFLMNPRTMRIMVVTEQPTPERVTKEDLKFAFDQGDKDSVPRMLEQLLNKNFSDSVKKENGPYYWTHFIKCPGKLRMSKKEREADKEKAEKLRQVVEARCAENHLKREIESLKPLLIISIGNMSSKWLFDQVPQHFDLIDCSEEEINDYKRDWREYLWREIKQDAAQLQLSGDAKATLICLVHPKERSGLGWFIDRKLKELVQSNAEKTLEVNQ